MLKNDEVETDYFRMILQKLHGKAETTGSATGVGGKLFPVHSNSHNCFGSSREPLHFCNRLS